MPSLPLNLLRWAGLAQENVGCRFRLLGWKVWKLKILGFCSAFRLTQLEATATVRGAGDLVHAIVARYISQCLGSRGICPYRQANQPITGWDGKTALTRQFSGGDSMITSVSFFLLVELHHLNAIQETHRSIKATCLSDHVSLNSASAMRDQINLGLITLSSLIFQKSRL